jgi:outer membrane translocation and assembly module TamA
MNFNQYIGIGQRHVIAWRVAGRFVAGDAPFFALSSLGSSPDLRGYAFGEYQGRHMLAGQVEYRLDVWWRFGIVGFAGMGQVANEWEDFALNQVQPSVGFGIRFRLSRDNPVNFRVDFAFIRDDKAMLLGLGEAF